VACRQAEQGQGGNTIAVFGRGQTLLTPRLVTDPELSPLDLKLAPNGNIVVVHLERLNGQALVLVR
jgi:hypothetical protein